MAISIRLNWGGLHRPRYQLVVPDPEKVQVELTGGCPPAPLGDRVVK